MNKKNQSQRGIQAILDFSPVNLTFSHWPDMNLNLKNNEQLSHFLEVSISRALVLDKHDFARFTAPHLPEDYYYKRWKADQKDFSKTFLNMDKDNKERFLIYVTNVRFIPAMTTFYFTAFCSLCSNYSTAAWHQNPFTGKYANTLPMLATGRIAPSSISGDQVFKLFKKLPTSGKEYLTWCAFGIIEPNKNNE